MLTEGLWEMMRTATLTWGSSAAGITKSTHLRFTSAEQQKNRNRRVRIDVRNASTLTALTCITRNRVTTLATTATYPYWATVSFPTAANKPYSRVLASGLGIGDFSSSGTIGRLDFSNDTAVNTTQGFKAYVKIWAERRA